MIWTFILQETHLLQREKIKMFVFGHILALAVTQMIFFMVVQLIHVITYINSINRTENYKQSKKNYMRKLKLSLVKMQANKTKKYKQMKEKIFLQEKKYKQ